MSVEKQYQCYTCGTLHSTVKAYKKCVRAHAWRAFQQQARANAQRQQMQDEVQDVDFGE